MESLLKDLKRDEYIYQFFISLIEIFIGEEFDLIGDKEKASIYREEYKRFKEEFTSYMDREEIYRFYLDYNNNSANINYNHLKEWDKHRKLIREMIRAHFGNLKESVFKKEMKAYEDMLFSLKQEMDKASDKHNNETGKLKKQIDNEKRQHELLIKQKNDEALKLKEQIDSERAQYGQQTKNMSTVVENVRKEFEDMKAKFKLNDKNFADSIDKLRKDNDKLLKERDNLTRDNEKLTSDVKVYRSQIDELKKELEELKRTKSVNGTGANLNGSEPLAALSENFAADAAALKIRLDTLKRKVRILNNISMQRFLTEYSRHADNMAGPDIKKDLTEIKLLMIQMLIFQSEEKIPVCGEILDEINSFLKKYNVSYVFNKIFKKALESSALNYFQKLDKINLYIALNLENSILKQKFNLPDKI